MAKSFSLNTISNITNKMTFDNFNKKVEKATSSMKSTPDWNTILEICDSVRHKDVTPKYALSTIKKKLYSRSAHQIFFTLLTLESMVKNCGPAIHEEVATVAFCEILHERLQTTVDQQIRRKILDMLQTWAYAFRDLPQYRPVHDIVMYLKKTGYRFPPLNVSDAMFATHVAPRFVDGDVCYKCNIAFSILTRRHHCRGCGQPFCQSCSTKTSILPRFGIEKPVRVCDNCYKNYGLPSLKRPQTAIEARKSLDFLFEEPAKPKIKSSDEMQEEEDLQLAIALSKSEAEHKEKQRRARMQLAFSPSANTSSKPAPTAASSKAPVENTEMSRYLNRNFWEKRAASSTASAPVASANSSTPSTSLKSALELRDNIQTSKTMNNLDDPEDKEIDEFMETLQTQIEIFVNRMKSDASRGRPVVNDTAVQSLFLNLTAMHTHLIAHIRQLDDKRTHLESLQNKVIEVREYRTALDLLKAEHAAQIATAQEVAEIRRQMELAVKLEALRKSKHNYLQYQRHIAFQRVQEEEREFQQGRHEMQKLPYMRSNHSGTYGRYPNGAITSNSPFLPSIAPGKSEAGPTQLTNLNSLRILPQNLLSQTRVQTISINHSKGKQLNCNPNRLPPPQNIMQDAQNSQEQRPMTINRDTSILNRPSQQQINQMYQNYPNFSKPVLAQQHNFTNLLPNQLPPTPDNNQYQRPTNFNEVNPMFLPQYPTIVAQNLNTTQKQSNIQINQQKLNFNQQYYGQNIQQNYPQNNQNPNSTLAQGNQQNTIQIKNAVPNLNTQNSTQTPNHLSQNLNSTQNCQIVTNPNPIIRNSIPITERQIQNNQNQQFNTIPNPPTQNQPNTIKIQNAVPNLNTQNSTQTPNHLSQNLNPTQNSQIVTNPNPTIRNSIPITQTQIQNPNNQNQQFNTIPNPPTQNHPSQNIPMTQNVSVTQNQQTPNITQGQPQNVLPSTQTQNILNNQNATTNLNMYTGKQIPQNNNNIPQNQQTQNVYKTPQNTQNVQPNTQGNNQNTQNQGLPLATPTAQSPNAQTMPFGQGRVQVNSAEYQEQTDKIQTDNQNYE